VLFRVFLWFYYPYCPLFSIIFAAIQKCRAKIEPPKSLSP